MAHSLDASNHVLATIDSLLRSAGFIGDDQATFTTVEGILLETLDLCGSEEYPVRVASARLLGEACSLVLGHEVKWRGVAGQPLDWDGLLSSTDHLLALGTFDTGLLLSRGSPCLPMGESATVAVPFDPAPSPLSSG